MKLVDADKIFQKVKGSTASKAVKCLAEVLVATAPAVDAVVVTRCKDCAYWKKTDQKQGPSVEHMEYIGSCVISRFYKKENDFCSDGEPKDEYHADDHD